mmetsp:Transcript_32018/g.107795  ORF Transcript_32018/g.107795 Transcript_32018/m.107795 type:complete len:269 (-) Transcript_32018:3-809(-)
MATASTVNPLTASRHSLMALRFGISQRTSTVSGAGVADAGASSPSPSYGTTSSAPASSDSSRTLSTNAPMSNRESAEASETRRTPLFFQDHLTELSAAMAPPPFRKMALTSLAVRLLLSVRASTTKETPPIDPSYTTTSSTAVALIAGLAPRSTAASIFAFGILASFPRDIADASDALFKSPTHCRLAVSMRRASFVNRTPRCSSKAPFLCLILAHLEWPAHRRATRCGDATACKAPGRRPDCVGTQSSRATRATRASIVRETYPDED